MQTNLLLLLALLLAANAPAAVRYVNSASPHPAPPFGAWTNAAVTIQAAVDASAPGDEIIVTNGIYFTGGRAVFGTMTNRVAVDRAVTVRSVNGPGVTILQGRRVPGATNGDGAMRCAYLTNGATLCGFTLTNGATRIAGDFNREQSGGGVWCESVSAVVSNCTLAGNSANWVGGGAYGGALNNCVVTSNSAYYGGGAYVSALRKSLLKGNLASDTGGGAYAGTLTNCTLTGNSADQGGGSYGATLDGCSLRTNLATYGGGAYAQSSTLNNCIFMGNSASFGGGACSEGDSTLNNCAFTGNTAYDGGGAWLAPFGGTLNNCTFASNSASYGGGAWLDYTGDLYNCTFTGNSAWTQGGGAFSRQQGGPRLFNCTLVNNSSAATGGGAYCCTLIKCIVYFNRSRFGANYDSSSTVGGCCTTPIPSGGTSNITADPLFVDLAGSNLRLQSNSPCINAGNSTYANSPNDMDGRPRIVGESIDIGAYEFQGAASGEFIGWLSQYSLPTDGTADFTDPDGDGFNNWQEWQLASNPTNAASFPLRLYTPTKAGGNLFLSWASATGHTYFIEHSANLSATPRFLPLATNLAGQPGTTSYTHTNAVGTGPRFYRIGVP